MWGEANVGVDVEEEIRGFVGVLGEVLGGKS